MSLTIAPNEASELHPSERILMTCKQSHSIMILHRCWFFATSIAHNTARASPSIGLGRPRISFENDQLVEGMLHRHWVLSLPKVGRSRLSVWNRFERQSTRSRASTPPTGTLKILSLGSSINLHPKFQCRGWLDPWPSPSMSSGLVWGPILWN